MIYRNVWYTMTFKNDATFIIKSSEMLYQFSEQLQAQTSDFTTHVAFQPLPRLYAEKAAAAGGNVLGLEHIPFDAIMLQVSVSVKDPKVAEWARARIEAFVAELRAFTKSRNGFVGWTYLNYAHGSQEVLQGYGEDNILAIQKVAAKYDPQGVFQKICLGGFKIAALGS